MPSTCAFEELDELEELELELEEELLLELDELELLELELELELLLSAIRSVWAS